MVRIIHSLPLFIRESSRESDLQMATLALDSLRKSDESMIVIYNQGCLTHEELQVWLDAREIIGTLLGSGQNVGIAAARQACFEYIWTQYPDVEYISEIHVDMIFPPNWYEPLLAYLERSGEPMVSPGILTASGELQPLQEFITLPDDPDELIRTLQHLSREDIAQGFVHPVIHQASVLRQIGGYDTRFLSGKQGYEDDSLLLGMRYYMGTRTAWRPKCCLESWVFHTTMAQRMSLPDKHIDFARNEEGLFRQYGVYGINELLRIHGESDWFRYLHDKYIADYEGVNDRHAKE
ncbi:hypothetical protein JCM10914A_01250 [Paenibacillus sp. JCM 10914]|uniref:hypothetical protein n=1 Tax=Paenibacillus sp. JCM 10914 TaxID=1236974 RepID=UPI0003CC6B1E|nr:hypothetical protein [Paenibacillus sp. JCM 10914]GAE06952.1 hypothetical protein JCM10914_3148 [Paenibacillus sp. JCM 10914]